MAETHPQIRAQAVWPTAAGADGAAPGMLAILPLCARPSARRPRRSAGGSPALSSLYKHLVRHDHAARNPVGEVERPAINRDEGSTLALSKAQARKMLDAPAEDTIAGLRDRAILSVGLQVGLRRAEIAALTVGDLHQNRGYESLCVLRKGGRRDALAINPRSAARLRAYLELAGHAADIDGPLFRPLQHNGKRRDEHRGMDPDAIDRFELSRTAIIDTIGVTLAGSVEPCATNLLRTPGIAEARSDKG